MWQNATPGLWWCDGARESGWIGGRLGGVECVVSGQMSERRRGTACHEMLAPQNSGTVMPLFQSRARNEAGSVVVEGNGHRITGPAC